MSVFKLPKQFTPGFSTSKKPTIPVELDRSNALCPDEFCVFLDNSPSDLVSGGVLTSNVDIERVIVNGSEARHFDGTAQEHYTLPKPMVSHGNAGVWTLTFRARRTGLSNDGVLLGVAGTSTDYIWLKVGNFTVNATGIQVNIFMPAYDSADMHTYTVFFDGTGYYHLSIDGEYYATSAYSESVSSLEISHIGACYTSAAYAYNGDFEYTYAHSRKLSASEIKSLHENPYQILKPSIPALYYPAIQEAVQSSVYPLELPKQFTPGFSTKEKPTVPVEIDWNQSLSKDIAVCYILGDSPHNLGNEQEAGSITISEFGVASGGTGQRTYDTDSAAKIITNNPDGNIWDEANTNHTIGFVGTILTDDNGAQGLWSIGGTGHGIGVGYKVVPHTLQLEYDFSVLELATQTVFPGDTIAPVVTSDTVGQTLHLKGDSVSSTNVMGSHTGDPELGSSYKNVAAAFGGVTHLFVIWRRVLTDEEIALFQANPYQILKPSIPAVYFPSEEVAGGGTTGGRFIPGIGYVGGYSPGIIPGGGYVEGTEEAEPPPVIEVNIPAIFKYYLQMTRQ